MAVHRDEDNDGAISKKEFRKAIRAFGFLAHDDELDAVFHSFDVDRGCVSWGFCRGERQRPPVSGVLSPRCSVHRHSMLSLLCCFRYRLHSWHPCSYTGLLPCPRLYSLPTSQLTPTLGRANLDIPWPSRLHNSGSISYRELNDILRRRAGLPPMTLEARQAMLSAGGKHALRRGPVSSSCQAPESSTL